MIKKFNSFIYEMNLSFSEFLTEIYLLKHILEDEHFSFSIEDISMDEHLLQYNLMISEYPYGPGDNISALDMSKIINKNFMCEFIDRLEETSIKFGYKFKHIIMRSGDNLPTGCFILTKII